MRLPPTSTPSRLLGYAPVPALATVVDGPSRPCFGCRSVIRIRSPRYGSSSTSRCVDRGSARGPGTTSALAGSTGIPLTAAPGEVAEIVTVSMPLLKTIVDVCTRTRMQAFHGTYLAKLANPERVSPNELEPAGRARRRLALHLDLPAAHRGHAHSLADRPARDSNRPNRRRR